MTERYASAVAGDGNKRIHEAKHLYSNSSSGLERAGHEQHLNGRARLAVTDYFNGRRGGSNQIFHGMNKTENDAFGQEFVSNARHLPERVKLGRDALDGGELSNFEKTAPAYGDRDGPVASLLGHAVW